MQKIFCNLLANKYELGTAVKRRLDLMPPLRLSNIHTPAFPFQTQLLLSVYMLA